ncbi:hypothetical protein QBC39DRAFT_394953 [Podospora conica]|nr:hypothetical protein QBC39DRAFT_394953 [Schizothecium conicum]
MEHGMAIEMEAKHLMPPPANTPSIFILHAGQSGQEPRRWTMEYGTGIVLDAIAWGRRQPAPTPPWCSRSDIQIDCQYSPKSFHHPGECPVKTILSCTNVVIVSEDSPTQRTRQPNCCIGVLSSVGRDDYTPWPEPSRLLRRWPCMTAISAADLDQVETLNVILYRPSELCAPSALTPDHIPGRHHEPRAPGIPIFQMPPSAHRLGIGHSREPAFRDGRRPRQSHAILASMFPGPGHCRYPVSRAPQGIPGCSTADPTSGRSREPAARQTPPLASQVLPEPETTPPSSHAPPYAA